MRRFERHLAACCAGLLAAAVAPPASWAGQSAPGQAARSPRNANYSIDATLDVARRLVTGRETLTWRNISGRPTRELQLHLYWNAWRNSRSTWLRERLLGDGRAARTLLERPARDWAWIDLTAIRLVDQGAQPFVDLTGRQRFLAPDDGNADDRTVVSVDLPSEVSPGATLTLEIEWTAQVPRPVARTGALGHYFFLAQWFPKAGVLQADGWNTHQFHAGTEFFADYGVYDVRLRVPQGWIIGATGREQSRTDNPDGSTTHRYVQDDVHDFAWTTSPDYLERRERFEQRGLPPVDMRLLLQPEHAGQAERHFAATRAALRYYGQWFGPYPYGHITIVDPAWQSATGGMEYPTLFTTGTRWLVSPHVAQPERVTVHEAGHQFWYGIVGNNEVDHAWLDEGFNTFATARTLEQFFTPELYSDRFFGAFLPWSYPDLPLARATDGNRLGGYRAVAESDAPATPSWRYFPSSGSAITYGKTALWLMTLERMLGWPTLQRVLATHFRRHSFGHPTPDDFFRTASEVSGRDLTWFFDQVYRSSNVFDYAIGSLESRPAAVRGFVTTDGTRAFSDGRGDGTFETVVVARRRGEAIFPVEVRIRFEDGSVARERWDGRDRWRAWRFERPSKAVDAVVDPDRVLVLDVDYTNNSRTLQPAADRAATKWSLTWLVWLQDLLMTFHGFFA